jgi:alanyl-tRNA synthetase
MKINYSSMMTSKQLRSLFVDFMASKGHSILHSASLLPKEDPTLLFVNSGMYPLVPYLLGADHPSGVRLSDFQKCIRTNDIEEVGDNRHLSFFEMFGSWSLGDYFKKESIEWGFEFLTSSQWLGLDPNRIYVTVYKGHDNIPEDTESIEIWKEQFQNVNVTPIVGIESPTDIYRITKKSGKDNWWGLPYRGPCGPCSEIYYLLDHNPIDFKDSILPSLSESEKIDFIDNQIVEIWNHVFMEYEGEWGDGDEPINLKPLSKKNIDTGGGFERLLTVINGLDTCQDTDLIKPISDVVSKWSR